MLVPNDDITISSTGSESLSTKVTVKRGKLSEIYTYEVTDDELETLAKGTPASIHLTFALPLLTVAGSALATLITVPMKSERVFNVFLCTMFVGGIMGLLLLCLWWRTRSPVKDVIERIKKRMPDEEHD